MSVLGVNRENSQYLYEEIDPPRTSLFAMSYPLGQTLHLGRLQAVAGTAFGHSGLIPAMPQTTVRPDTETKHHEDP